MHTTLLTSGLFFAVLGIGMGFLMQTTTLIVQNSVDPRDMGVAGSSRTFFQQIGGSIGVSTFGAIFASRLVGAMSSRLPGVHLNAAGGQLDPATVNRLPALLRHDVLYAISHAIQGVFVWAAPSAVFVCVLAWFIKVPLRGRAPSSEAPVGEPELVA